MSISFENVEKIYPIYDKPQDRLLEWVFKKNRHKSHAALSGINFDLQSGETFGLIGENGAGKSTLLKIAAGTIQPTRGHVNRQGRVAALLELGAGFHPDESGYDNIRFMAALHGLQGEKLDWFFQSAINFSELPDDALRRPVKTYSSGMFMRLAFSTATAIEPEILIIDEALSVGDLHFQKKSLNRILELKEKGATILFCSHNLYQVRSLCQRAAWIHSGRIQAIGGTEIVVSAYESYERQRYVYLRENKKTNVSPGVDEKTKATESFAPVKIMSVCLETADGVNPSQLESFQDATLKIEVESYGDMSFHVGFVLVKPDKENVFGSSTQFAKSGEPLKGSGFHELKIKFANLKILSGDYLWSIYTLDDSGLQVLDMAELINPFSVINQKCREVGVFWLDHKWV